MSIICENNGITRDEMDMYIEEIANDCEDEYYKTAEEIDDSSND